MRPCTVRRTKIEQETETNKQTNGLGCPCSVIDGLIDLIDAMRCDAMTCELRASCSSKASSTTSINVPVVAATCAAHRSAHQYAGTPQTSRCLRKEEIKAMRACLLPLCRRLISARCDKRIALNSHLFCFIFIVMSTSFHHQPQTNTYLGLHSYILFPGHLLHHLARPLCLSPPEVVLAVPTSVLVPLLHCLRHLIPLFLPFLLSYSLTLLLFFFLPNLVTKIRVLASPCPPRGWLSDFLYLSFFCRFFFFARSPDSIHSLHHHLPL
ncbi:hypothetical protein J3E68DRAFT_403184, partial [Trichoderma sp. SZMC 28012]